MDDQITAKLFYELPYETIFEATVMACIKKDNQYQIILDKTLFYPEGGGQPADMGLLGDLTVTDVCESGETIFHIANEPIAAGTIVQGKIDWPRRFSFMQNHTGEHIVSGIINKLFGLDNVGFHMGSENITVDVNGELSEADLSKVEQAANAAVYQNIEVLAEYPAKEALEAMPYRSKKALQGDIRIVTVPSYDMCACCGIHCRNTGEIGIIKIINAQKYKGGTRIYMLCGERALQDYADKNNIVYKISALLSSKPNEISGAVNQLLSENAALKQQNVLLKDELFKLKAQAVPDGSKSFSLFEKNLTADDLRRLATELAERAQIALAFSAAEDNSYKYAICSRTVDLQGIVKPFNAALSGRGGGKKELVQGTIIVSKEDIENYIKANL